MWLILKNELSYTKDVLILSYGIAAALLLLAVLVTGWGLNHYMWTTTVIYFIFMGITGGDYYAEKRVRCYSTLPITPMQFVKADTVYVSLVQLGMFVLWVLYLILKGVNLNSETLWVMLANNAAVLSVVNIFGIQYHLGFFETKNYKRIIWGLLAAFVGAVIALWYFERLEGVADSARRYYASPAGALTSLLACIALFFLSANLFFRRKSYLA